MGEGSGILVGVSVAAGAAVKVGVIPGRGVLHALTSIVRLTKTRIIFLSIFKPGTSHSQSGMIPATTPIRKAK